jgi:hypothetical protein
MAIDPNQSLLQSKNQSQSDVTPAQIAPTSSRITFAFQNVQPPSQLYIDVDDQLVISGATTQANEVITVNCRLLEPTGRLQDMQFQIRPTNNRLVVRTPFGLAQGYILSVSVSAAIATTRGMTFARVAIQRSAGGTGQPAQMLFADYITTQSMSAYPSGRVLSPSEGPGNITEFTQANPLAGFDWQINVPVNTRWRVQAIDAVFTASAAVANRQVSFLTFANLVVVMTATDAANITASQAVHVTISAAPVNVPVNPLKHVIPIAPQFYINGSAFISQALNSSTLGLQAADQWSAIDVTLEEWLDNV